MQLRPLTDQITLADQLTEADLVEIVAAGFKTVICNRPDEEGEAHLSASDAQPMLEANGVEFHYLPVNGAAITDQDVVNHTALLAGASAPVLTYCRTGTRCAKLWALGQAGQADADSLVSKVADTGLNIADIRDRLV